MFKSLNIFALRYILEILFFISGCSALLYQIIWQRMLFIAFGTDLESITIIVSVFMFGLGIGGLCGGFLADRVPSRLLMLYIIIELSIAVFGFLSPYIIASLGTVLSTNEFITASMSFLILVIPTLLMGATFPILVMHVNQFDENIGHSVGKLYFANTLGGATGALLSGFFLLNIMGVIGVINCAAILNIAVAMTALFIFWRRE